MQSFNCLFSGWEVVNTVGLAKGMASVRRWGLGLPVALVLDEGDAIPSMLILCSNEERHILASDEDVSFGMH